MALALPGIDGDQGHLFEPEVFREIRERSLSASDRGLERGRHGPPERPPRSASAPERPA